MTGRGSDTTSLFGVWVNTDSKGAFDESDSKRPTGEAGGGERGWGWKGRSRVFSVCVRGSRGSKGAHRGVLCLATFYSADE